MIRASHAQRGQTLPMMLGGVVATLAFAFFAINYGNQLRWQIRAQNAADSAAQAMLSIQTTQFNQMTAVLYAAAVEEYRIRRILNGMVLASHNVGGCTANGANAPNGCVYIEQTLQTNYLAAVQRYSADVQLLHRVTATLTYANARADSLALLSQIAQCSSNVGGDCAFKYGAALIQPRDGTEAVYMDANAVLKPEPGAQTPYASTVVGADGATLNDNLFAPMQVEVYACAVVPSIVPSFFGFSFPSFSAVARGAATPAIVEEDWLQPGAINNPYTNKYYQPPENYIGGTVTDSSTGYDWYNLDFGGNGFVAIGGAHYGFTITNDEFSVKLGWWNSIPIHPFGPPKSLASMGCS